MSCSACLCQTSSVGGGGGTGADNNPYNEDDDGDNRADEGDNRAAERQPVVLLGRLHVTTRCTRRGLCRSHTIIIITSEKMSIESGRSLQFADCM